MFVVLWGLAAEAGVPISLPPGQRPSDWEEVLRLGDLDWATSDAVVVVSAAGPVWTVRIRDPSGGVREASVDAPLDPDAREDLVWLVVSLLTPVTSVEPEPERAPTTVTSVRPRPAPAPLPNPVVVTPVPAAPRPAPVAPRPTVVPAPAPEPIAVVASPPEPRPAPSTPKPSAPKPVPEVNRRPPAPLPVPRPPRPPPPEDPGLRPWVRLVSGVGLRPALSPSWSGVLSVGLARDTFGLGVGVGVGSRTSLPTAGRGRAFAATPIVVEGLYGPRHVLLGAQLGAEHRRFFDGDDVQQAGFMPFLRAETAVVARLGSRLHLEPGIAFRSDLGSTEIQRDGVLVLRVPSSTFQLTVALRYR